LWDDGQIYTRQEQDRDPKDPQLTPAS
jgi:hypothetical protein